MELHVPRLKGSLPTLVAMALLVFALQAPTVAAVQASPSANQLLTLEPATSRERLQEGATAFLSSLLSRPANQEIRLAKANPALISAETRELVIPVSDNERVTFQQRSFEVTKQGMQVWYGDVASDRKQRFSGPEEVDTDPFNNAMIVRDGEKLVGNVRVAGQAYRLDALENGRHAFIKVDESRLPPEEEPLMAPDDASQGSAATSWQPKSSHSDISVLVVTTNRSKLSSPNVQADIQLMISHANRVNLNSDVAITFQLAGTIDVDYVQGDKTNSEVLAELRATGSALGQIVHPRRQALSADLVTMLIPLSSSCGRAYINATRTSAFSIIGCSSAFAHELGHNIGANHNWEPGDSVTTPPYNNGYRHTGNPRFRTQLSYECPTGGSCPRVDFWSTPRKTWQGIPLGTAEYHDNARRFNERREFVEGFY